MFWFFAQILENQILSQKVVQSLRMDKFLPSIEFNGICIIIEVTSTY